jgi:hypothetical protein
MTASRQRWIMGGALLALTGIAFWQAFQPVPSDDPITAALFRDVRTGGAGLALGRLAEMTAGDTLLNANRHVYAHAIGRLHSASGTGILGRLLIAHRNSNPVAITE